MCWLFTSTLKTRTNQSRDWTEERYCETTPLYNFPGSFSSYFFLTGLKLHPMGKNFSCMFFRSSPSFCLFFMASFTERVCEKNSREKHVVVGRIVYVLCARGLNEWIQEKFYAIKDVNCGSIFGHTEQKWSTVKTFWKQREHKSEDFTARMNDEPFHMRLIVCLWLLR